MLFLLDKSFYVYFSVCYFVLVDVVGLVAVFPPWSDRTARSPSHLWANFRVRFVLGPCWSSSPSTLSEFLGDGDDGRIDVRHSGAGFTSLVDASSRVHQLFRQCQWDAFRRWKVGDLIIISFCSARILSFCLNIRFCLLRVILLPSYARLLCTDQRLTQSSLVPYSSIQVVLRGQSGGSPCRHLVLCSHPPTDSFTCSSIQCKYDRSSLYTLTVNMISYVFTERRGTFDDHPRWYRQFDRFLQLHGVDLLRSCYVSIDRHEIHKKRRTQALQGTSS